MDYAFQKGIKRVYHVNFLPTLDQCILSNRTSAPNHFPGIAM